MFFSAVAAGALWAAVPAVFKARFNTNETLFTLMMNYVAMQLVSYFCVRWENPKGSSQIGVINSSTKFGWLPQLSKRYLLPIVVAVIMTVLVFIFLRLPQLLCIPFMPFLS